MGLARETLDAIVRVRTINPFVAVHPHAYLKSQTAGDGLLADELQRFQIAIAFSIRERSRAHLVTRNRNQKRIGKKKVSVGDLAQEVVTETEGKIESIEALGGQHRQIARPHFSIVVPGFVFDI